jgi:hypothetical protein
VPTHPSLANTSRGWVYSPPPHPPRSQTRAGGEVFLPTTQAHEGPQQPTMANKGQCRSTKAHSSQRRPTKTKKGLNDARHVIWALGVFFLLFFSVLLTTHHVSQLHHTHHTHCWPGQRPQRPTAANKGQRRPTKTKKGPNNARHAVWAIGTFFFKCTIYFLFFITTRPCAPTRSCCLLLRPPSSVFHAAIEEFINGDGDTSDQEGNVIEPCYPIVDHLPKRLSNSE